jgi:4-amino-4-deoxy-L-arabinose transferase-like glycosyltransferase
MLPARWDGPYTGPGPLETGRAKGQFFPMTDSQTGPELIAQTESALSMPAPAPGKMLAWAGRHALPLLALFCLALWLPGIVSLPALDRDESRFAQSSRQMLETGNYVDIRLGHVPRYKKPVGIYWLQSATTALAAPFVGIANIWTYRLASLLGAILAVWLTVWCARAVAGAEAAFLSGALMAGTLLLAGEATLATTDAVLLACVLGTQGVLLRVWCATRKMGALPPSTRTVLWGWAALAAGILVKGPVAPAVAALTLIGLCLWDWWEKRRAGSKSSLGWLLRLKPLIGVPVLLAIVLPWLIAIAQASHGAFFQQSLGDDFAAKLANGQESHGAPPGYYLALMALTFWPAILFVAPGIVLAIARRSEPAVKFLLVWTVGWWILVEAVPTKLPHYILPVYPALAILAALWVTGCREPMRWERTARWIGGVQFVVGAISIAAVLVVAPNYYGAGDPIWLWVVTALGLTLALTALSLLAYDIRGWAAALALMAPLLLTPALTAGVGPRLSQLWLTTRLAGQEVADAKSGDPPPVLAGYDEPSMLFALGADTVLSNGTGAADLVSARGGLALIEARERGAFLARLAEKQADATALQTVEGFNYSRGKAAAVTIYRVAPVENGAAPQQ